jgi:hypothetical protein
MITKTVARRTAVPNRLMTLIDVQPQSVPFVNPMSRELSEPARSSVPGRSSVARFRMGDSGTQKCTRTITAAVGIAPAMNSHRHER